MKKLIFILFLSIFLLGSVYALDCQYTDIEYYNEIDSKLVNNVGKILAEPFEISPSTIIPQGFPTIEVYNPNRFDLSINISYTQVISSSLTGTSTFDSNLLVEIPSFSNVTLKGEQGFGPGYNNYIDLSSIKYQVIEPEELELKNVEITKNQTICKICPNGKQCLDDGVDCSISNECGSGICNIAGICGTKGSLFIVPCPNGKLNCKNESCLTPSTKEVGEAYSCDWECKSDRGKDGKCLPSIKELVYWIMGISLTIILIGISIIYFIKNGPLTEKVKELEDKIKDLETQSTQKEKEIKKLEEKGADLNDMIKENEKLIKIEVDRVNSITQIISLKKEELKHLRGKIKRRTEEELRDLEHNIREIKEKEVSLKQVNDKLEKEQRRKEKIELEERKIETAKLLGVSKDRIILYGEYFRWKENKISNGMGEFAHMTLYKRHISSKIPMGYEVHHIDGDHKNNNLWNLIAIKKELHFGLQGGIVKKGWEFGLKYLLEQKIVKEEDLHDYIKTHRKELKEQRSLKI